jgi:hypothetical protein
MADPLAREAIFGRRGDVARLNARTLLPGVTVVAGRPQEGKTLLLRHFVDQVRLRKQVPRPYVGYFESQQTARDHFLYAIQDLYKCWLDKSTFKEQFKALPRLQKRDLGGILSGAGKELSRLLKFLDPSGLLKSLSRECPAPSRAA